MLHLGKTILRLRADRKMSQRDLAHAAGLTPSYLSLVENDRRRPSLLVIQKLASALSLPEEVLIWEAVELPRNLSKKDKRVCDMAKLIVRRFFEAGRE